MRRSNSWGNRNRSGNRRRPENFRRPRNTPSYYDRNNISPQFQQPASSSDIPGFYWDAKRQRYFKVCPYQFGAGTTGAITESGIKAKSVEMERIKEMEGEKMMIAADSTPDETRNKSNFLNVLAQRNMGQMKNLNSFRRKCQEFTVRSANPPKAAKVLKVSDARLTRNAMLECCQFLSASEDGKKILGAWKREGVSCTRIMCLDANINQHNITEDWMGLEMSPPASSNIIDVQDPYVNDVCKAKVDRSVMCILCVTTPLLPNLGSHVFLSPVPEMSTVDDFEFLRSPVYNLFWKMEESVWSCAWNSKKMRIGMGMDKHGLIVDVLEEHKFKLNSLGKNILAQEFSKNGDTLFMGLRGAEILISDLRLSSKRGTGRLNQSSTHWLKLLQDDNYIFSSNFHGEIKLWDLRKKRVVYDFSGHNNSYTKVSCLVDDTENLIFAAGEDGKTRGWSIKTGEQLCSVPSPYPVTGRSSVPKIAYSNTWGGQAGTPALILGVRDELHVYQLTL